MGRSPRWYLALKATAPWESLTLVNALDEKCATGGMSYERIDLSRTPHMSLIGMIFDIWMRVAQRAFDSMIQPDPLVARGAVQD